MLSIRFNSKADWWVSGEAFTRLFEAALRGGNMPADLRKWLDVADANGGLDLSRLAPDDASVITAALRVTAERETEHLKNARPTTPDGSYRASLEKLLALEQST